MQEMNQIESVRDLMTFPRRAEGLYVIRGEVLREIYEELRKGDRARWILREVVEAGMTEGKSEVVA